MVQPLGFDATGKKLVAMEDGRLDPIGAVHDLYEEAVGNEKHNAQAPCA